ncbi:MAG: hypothetical protein WCP29_05650 [Acidobacteriota bacterium]
MDQMLECFLAAPEAEANQQLGDLLTIHAAPVIRRVIFNRLGVSCAEGDDVDSQVQLELMLRLRRGRVEQDIDHIDSFAGYAAAAAHHACDHHLRRKYPLRWRLRNRIRYMLEHDRGFALWKTAGGTWCCGRAGWVSRPPVEPPPVEDLTDTGAQRILPLLDRLFLLSDGPLELRVVVDLAATAWHVPLYPQQDKRDLDALSGPHAQFDVTIAHRETAWKAWEEIRLLPVRQRQALLLNLKDDAMSLFLATGTASLRAMARCLEMTVEALTAIWNDLPLPDNDVAERLGCTRQQVINLRMAARKRLANRLSGWH